MSKKYKHHGYSELLKYMHILEDGHSINYVREKFGIDGRRLTFMWEQYQSIGPLALKKRAYIHADLSYKLQAIKDFEEKGLSLVEIMSKYNISQSAFYQWRKTFHSGGEAALAIAKPPGRPPGMGRPKKKTASQMTELERLQKENQELKTELALLKKVRALVEERNARLREIGRESSKN